MASRSHRSVSIGIDGGGPGTSVMNRLPFYVEASFWWNICISLRAVADDGDNRAISLFIVLYRSVPFPLCLLILFAGPDLRPWGPLGRIYSGMRCDLAKGGGGGGGGA